jgi:hypothetical protein
METSQAERTFYQDADVTVTQARFVTQNKTYAMRNISSVSLYHIASSRIFQIILLALGLLMLLDDGLRTAGFFMAVIGGLWLYFTKDSYAVRISTNSGETNSVISKDKEYVTKIVNALTDAIVHRG